MAIQHVTAENGRLLQQIADSIANARRIVLIAGAGISTNCGIPDFRSEHGLYSLIETEHDAQSQNVDAAARRVKGRDLFDVTLWNSELSTSVFYKFIAGLRRKVRRIERASPTHRFIRTLRDKKKLVRAYTQNIDGLEEHAGLKSDLDQGLGSKQRFAKRWTASPLTAMQNFARINLDGGCEIVELHGNLKVLRCSICQYKSEWDEEREASFIKGEAPDCPYCAERNQERLDDGKRRLPVGALRPNIVLYGEEHPHAEEIAQFLENDIPLVDVLLIFGTSLKVHGLKNVVRQFANAAHARSHGKGKVFFINNSQPAESTWKGHMDAWIEMDCDAFVNDVRRRRPDIWTSQAVLPFKFEKGRGDESAGKAASSGSENSYARQGLPARPGLGNKRVPLGSTSRGNMSSSSQGDGDEDETLPEEGGLKRKRAARDATEAGTKKLMRVRLG